MSVIVKGMEMPENCTRCDYIGLNVAIGCPVMSGTNGRATDCPLIALPDHHGRLVDADALLDRIRNPYEQAEVARWANEQPTIEPERWIPCSERLPEPRKAVLGYAPRYQNIYALYYDSAYGWMIWNPLRDDCFPNSQGEIVAWMPLPEPYREDES